MLSEKNRLEVAALKQFSLVMEHELGVGRFLFVELKNPPVPDGLCSLDGASLYVEVGHLYGQPSDAKQLLGRARMVSPEQRENSALIPLDERLLPSLNKLLQDKSTKKYVGSPVWLLIRSAFPLWTLEDFNEHRSSIRIPETHSFDQIWLLCGSQASDGLLRLA